MSAPDPAREVLRFVRHGATAANTAGLRCGGDLDPPMTNQGHAQMERVAEQIATLRPSVEVIVTSDLVRTRDTAAIIARRLPRARVIVEPGFAERRLGRWNLLRIRDSQPWLEAGLTPPGGESDDEFSARIAGAVERLRPELAAWPLLVGSKGVARVLGEMTGAEERLEPDNGDVLEFDLSLRSNLVTAGSDQ
jgi:2,3-bisphosphoglycerate-dependent phosphoglycerate mutase